MAAICLGPWYLIVVRHGRSITLLSVALLSSCGGNKAAEPRAIAAESRHDAERFYAALPPLFRNQEPALANAAALHYLPDTTFAAVVLKSPASVATAIESTNIFREYADFYQEAAREFRLPGGAHILDVASWAALGVDTEAPAGAAFWVQEDVVGVFFISLSDPDFFMQAMEDSAQSSGLPVPQKGQLASAQVIRFGPEAELAIVTRAKLGFVVIADSAVDLSLAVQTLAGVGNTQSLSGSGRIARAFADLDYGEDLAGFVAFDSIAERIEADMRKGQGGEWYTEEIGRLEISIELAKTEHRSQVEIDNLEKELEARLVEHNRYQLRRSGEARLSTDIIHPLGTLAFGIDLDGRDTRARLAVQPTKDSLPAKLLAHSPKALVLPSRLTETPLFMLAARVSSTAANQLFEIVMQADGETRSSVTASLRAETGLELAEVLALFEGELSMAFTFNRQAFQRARASAQAFSDALGLHLLFELNDQDAAEALLAKAATSAKIKRYAVIRDGHVGLEIPSFNRRKLRVELVQGFLELRTIGAPAEPPAWTDLESELLSSPDNAALMLIDPIMLGWSAFAGSQGGYSDMKESSTSRLLSAATAARLAEIREEKQRLRAHEQVLRSEQITASSMAVGRLVTMARLRPSGLAFLATLSSKSANLGRAFQYLLEVVTPEIESARIGKRSALEEITQQIRALDEESWRLADDVSP